MDLHFQERGCGTDTCLLIHGFGEGSYVWESTASVVSKAGFRCVSLDLPGHGESPPSSSGSYGIELFADAVCAAIEAMTFHHLVIIGHSLGAELAIRSYDRFINRIRGLVLVDFSPEIDESAIDKIMNDFTDSFKKYKSIDEYSNELKDKRFLVRPRLIEYIATSSLKRDVGGSFILRCDPALSRMKIEQDSLLLWERVRRVYCPTLVLRGEGSALLSKDTAERLIGYLPNGRLRTIRMAGHGVMLDNPGEFEKNVLRFLSEIRSGKLNHFR